MANIRISELTEKTGNNVSANDTILITTESAAGGSQKESQRLSFNSLFGSDAFKKFIVIRYTAVGDVRTDVSGFTDGELGLLNENLIYFDGRNGQSGNDGAGNPIQTNGVWRFSKDGGVV